MRMEVGLGYASESVSGQKKPNPPIQIGCRYPSLVELSDHRAHDVGIVVGSHPLCEIGRLPFPPDVCASFASTAQEINAAFPAWGKNVPPRS